MPDTTYRDDDQEYEDYCRRMTALREMLPDLIAIEEMYALPSPPEAPADLDSGEE